MATYTVKKGDTLGAIARQLGTSVDNLTGYRSGNKDLIFPGETITVKSPVENEATQRASTVRSELTDTPSPTNTPKSKDSSYGGFDFDQLQTNLADAQKKREEAFAKLDGFRSNRYEELSSERGLDDKRSEISKLDELITQKKNERDASIAQIRKNPGASAATLTGEVGVATDKLNAEINNLIGQRNSLANEYNTTLSEIDSLVEREAQDLENSLGFFDTSVSEAQGLIDAYQKALIEELRREEDRSYDLEDDLRDFEQAMQLARLKEATGGAGTNYTILTDQFGRPTVAIDKKNPTVQIDLSGAEGSLPKGGTDPALLQSIANQQNQDSGGGFLSGISNWFKGLFN